MPRVNKSTAKKDYPEHGIAKGDVYYHWTPFRSAKRYSKEYPRPSVVEPNGTRSAYLALQESLSDALEGAETMEDLRSAVESAASEAQAVSEELHEKAANIEDGFGHATERSDEFEGQADEVDAWASDLEGLSLDDFDIDDLEEGQDVDEETESTFEAAKTEVEEALAGAPEI